MGNFTIEMLQNVFHTRLCERTLGISSVIIKALYGNVLCRNCFAEYSRSFCHLKAFGCQIKVIVSMWDSSVIIRHMLTCMIMYSLPVNIIIYMHLKMLFIPRLIWIWSGIIIPVVRRSTPFVLDIVPICLTGWIHNLHKHSTSLEVIFTEVKVIGQCEWWRDCESIGIVRFHVWPKTRLWRPSSFHFILIKQAYV